MRRDDSRGRFARLCYDLGMPAKKSGASLQANDTLNAYIQEIAKFPRLTPEQEKTLGERIRQGDKAALNRLVESNLRFVVSYAKRYRGLGLPFLDLIHEGNLGLIEAARRFDPDRNVKFITYAVWWIRQAIVHLLSEHARAFALPPKLSGVAAHVATDIGALTAELERAPSREEVAEDLEISVDDADALMHILGEDVSLSARRGEDGEAEVGDTIEQELVPPVESELIRDAFVHQLRDLIGELDAKEQEVIRLRFGLDDGDPKTLQEVGQRLGLTRERIRQIESKAKEKLRRSAKCQELRSYLN